MVRILVTGASGFLGSHVADELFRRGHELRLLLRRTSSLSFLEGVEYERAEGDVRDEAALRRALPGVDAVVHAAGLVAALTEREYMAVNAQATETLVRAAAQAGVRRFVYVSSQAARGPVAEGAVDAARPPAPVSAYGRSKLAGETPVLAAAAGMSVAVLRPPVVYGPRDRALIPLYRLAGLGFVPVFGDGSNLLAWIYAEDAAAAIADAALADGPSGSVYSLFDGVLHTWRDLVEAFARASGRRVRVLKIPPPLYSLAGQLGGGLSALLRRPLPLTSDDVRHMRARRWACDNELISRELGWEPRVDIDEGFRRALAWYREKGWL